ncbi:MAG: hypothetical protein H0X27_09065 [Caulobacteraceae bacterium]|nr:hypothetical protein [Caulobacteraceae bacterium]
MPTQRGFVERLEIGRQGLAVATLLHDDASRAAYQIPDLDADPERFNERLSKLGMLRDAMDRGEPVEIEYLDQEGVRLIDRVARITRDNLDPAPSSASVSGMVVGVVVAAHNRTGPQAEMSDAATVSLLKLDGLAGSYLLDLQIPERATAAAQLELIRDAQASGAPITLAVDGKDRIVSVQAGGGAESGGGQGQAQLVDGFVEAISQALSAGAYATMALARFTTAPPFAGDGNVVALQPFTPALEQFLVVTGSPEHELFLTALREKLRMRVRALALGPPRPPDKTPGVSAAAKPAAARVRAMAMDTTAASGGDDTYAAAMLVRGAEVLHCLASASRPVWIQVSRKSLDVGPEAPCADGLPSSDLSVSTLRDLDLPYCASWCGVGCFNHGVYRFQFGIQSPFEISVDGEPLCVHASDDGATRFAHACLDGEHEVCVTLSAWSCAQTFLMDAYRIR